MVDSLERHMKNPGCPVILTAVFEGVMAYLKCTRPISTTLVDAAVAVARTALNSQQNNPQSFHQPGRGLLVEVCTNLLMAQDLINDIFVDLSSTAYCEDQHLIALQNLSLNPKRLTTSVLIYIIDRASTQKGSNALRIAALQALTACSWPQEVTAGIEPIRRRWACNQLQYTMLNTKCVPLKEALLPALGCLSSWVRTCVMTNILSSTDTMVGSQSSGTRAALI